MKDLFLPIKSKRDQLLEWILSRNMTLTSEIDQWGLDNYHVRARRDAQEMAAAGLIRRMTNEEERFYLKNSKQGAFVEVGFK